MIGDIDIPAVLESLRDVANAAYDVSDEELAAQDEDQRDFILTLRAAYRALDRGDSRGLERILAQQMCRVLQLTAPDWKEDG